MLIFTPFCVIDCAVLSSCLINLPFTYNTFFPSHSIFMILPNYLYLFHFIYLFLHNPDFSSGSSTMPSSL